ncbi:hypothetical protein FACS1894211_14580 [Clostridia bacterium]|nr:hypothetical protein FACS1894211_14580 [Clostridia bacterium]
MCIDNYFSTIVSGANASDNVFLPAPVMRAADMQPRDYSAYKAGMTVEHPKFGRGDVVAVNAGLAEIRFTAAGKKTLSLAFAPLTIVEK